MLPAQHRMRRSGDFQSAMRGRVRIGRDSIVVHLAPGDGNAQVGFVVSRAVGNAVTRNLVKRRLRAVVASRLEEVPPGARLVVRALPAAAATPFGQLESQFDSAMRRAHERSGAGR